MDGGGDDSDVVAQDLSFQLSQYFCATTVTLSMKIYMDRQNKIILFLRSVL